MPKLLIVDDDRDWIEMLRATLEPAGYDLVVAHDGQEALRAHTLHRPDLVLLDIEMPGMDGHDVCRRLRAWSDVPILVLSVHGERTPHVTRILREGSDDIMSKMRGFGELLARIEVILRRASTSAPIGEPRIYDDGVIHIDLETGTHVLKRGNEVALTPTEAKLLKALLDRQGEFVPHAELLQSVWGEEYGPETEYLAVYVYYLRGKLEDDPSRPRYIVTKHRFGYGFVPDIQDQSDLGVKDDPSQANPSSANLPDGEQTGNDAD